MEVSATALVLAGLDDISRLWVEELRRTPRTEVHKTMLTAEIVAGTKAIVASVAQAADEERLSAGREDSNEGTRSRQRTARQGATRPLAGPMEMALAAAGAHGELRHQQSFQIHELVCELAMLRNGVHNTLSKPGSGDERTSLLRSFIHVFDEVMVRAVEAFHERAIRDFERRAIRDPLTHLYNREYFHDRLQQELRRCLRYSAPLALALIDMDLLKGVNDTLGHQAGDAVLIATAKAIEGNCRQTDIPCRYGGDEFAVILPETSRAQARVFAERLLRAVRDAQTVVPVPGEQAHPQVAPVRSARSTPLILPLPTLSVGLAGFPEDGRNPESIIGRADAALYLAKRRGRNTVAW